MRAKLLPLGLLFLLGYLFCYPANALAASRDGLGLWLHTLLPTLLPFLILSSLLLQTDVIPKLLFPLAPLWKYAFGLSPFGAYALLLGMLCGYPMGAKLTADLHKEGKLPYEEACYLLTFVGSASPAFLITYLVLLILERPDYVLPTLCIVYSCNYLTCLVFRLWRHFLLQPALAACAFSQNSSKKETSSQGIDVSILNGFETMTRLGGYILLFSLTSAALQTFWPGDSLLRELCLSLTEISTGLHHLKGAFLPFPLKYAIAVSATSFGGFCILFQTKSVICEAGLPLMPYVVGKLCNLLLTFGVSLFVAQII